ncbi:MAG: DUF2235 domain-containing protein [Rubrivivax sp.]|nr:MAG: DUF2235 domain-containing protein [Rubrivivax sp.]
MQGKNLVRRITGISQGETFERKASRSTLDLQSASKEQCKTCPKPVWFTAFFDGTGNNYGKDGYGEQDVAIVKYSNIAKLAWFAHVPSESKPRTAFAYIEGVGTPCMKKGVMDTGEGIDNALGMAAAAKGEARILWMMRELKEHVDKHMPFVNQINIAVFGFSRGATQARAFTRMLAEGLAEWDGQDLLWKQAGAGGVRPKVNVYFLGVFDTVASTGFGGSRGEKFARHAGTSLAFGLPGGLLLGPTAGGVLRELDKGGHAAWAQDIAIPPYVGRCVHFVAGHEVREKFPSDSVRQNKVLPSNCVEVVYPGVHSDVGGGYGPANDAYQEGRVNELARIPLCHMYIEAYKAGVPLDSPADVQARAGSLFDISPELERVFNGYMSGAPAWINERLESAVVWHMNRYYEWRESRRRRMNDKRLQPTKVDPYMHITDAEWEKDVLAIARARTGFFKGGGGVQESAIFDAYQRKLVGAMKPDERQDFDLLFDKYVHDSIAGFKKQMKEASAALALTEMSRWSVNRKYFVGRRGNRFLYWRYETDGTAYADIKFDDSNIAENYDSEEAKRARQGELEAREFQRTR